MASPSELLTPSEDETKSVMSIIWAPSLGATIGFTTACLINFGSRRPVMSGIQKHVIGMIVGVAAAKYAENRRDIYLAERDAIYRHYVELHFKEFPAPERKKYSELFMPWTPIR